ncbi:coproporphyrinogen III oxidase [Sulfurimonas paralvinellae]|uniref:coproporphyrinogen oxidase n=1 Tax=Sulfurimonas paralvinellae TaxID=317658 RepID=A0A7M1B6U4_9BACT|nr:coproporphyrinogen III oxidase [Sulfurimonas paralvinellae]QOP45434.1 coproporphyrinogen III oxidase [Sulfurimonas paralvinellae]
MQIIMAGSQEAKKAYALVRDLQKRFVDKLDTLTDKYGNCDHFEEVTWLRDEGLHGGGSRFEARDEKLFNTASVNVSQVHYDELPDKQLQSATAISTIIHPNNSHVPSIHIHISLTELREGRSYWRIMTDLNPSIVNMDDRERFYEALQNLSGMYYEEGVEQGDKYFAIPALKQTRGVSHFYLENFKTEDAAADMLFAQTFGEGIIDAYIEIIDDALASRKEISEADRAKQLAYHTLYLFQVLTLDRGTTAGLLVHNQNDVGIMGSLPSHINKELLASWIAKVPQPQDALVRSLLDAIDDDGAIDINTKEKLAAVVREHYTKHPEALKMQASGDTLPTTVANHTKV